MRKAVTAALVVSVLLAVAFLLAPPMGTDLSAQVARAEFFRDHGGLPIDFRWYGGTNQFGYSLVTPALMAVLGVRVLGAVAAVVASVAFAYILVATGARRPVAGGVVGAVCLVGDIASGRITFAVGVAFAMPAFALIASGRWPRWVRVALLAALGILTTVTSPVAGLFGGVAAGAILLPEIICRQWRRWPDALAFGIGAAVGLAPMMVFGDPGAQPFGGDAVRVNIAIAIAVVLLVPAAYRPIRAGALLAIALLLFALYVPSAIGSNSMRLTILFGLPVIVAYASLSRWLLIGVAVALVWWQNPVMTNDIEQAGSAETRASFYRPLLAELDTLGPLGRIEVVPLRDHWESRFVADEVPLARGWERQVDTDRNAIFYDGTLTTGTYGAWLRDWAVSYVALPVAAPLDTYAKDEAAIIREGPAYLTPVWSDADWRLYRVSAPQPFVSGGTLVSSGAASVVVDASGPGDMVVRVAWSRWLTVATGCVAPGSDGWTTVRVPAAGRYTLTSALTGARRC